MQGLIQQPVRPQRIKGLVQQQINNIDTFEQIGFAI